MNAGRLNVFMLYKASVKFGAFQQIRMTNTYALKNGSSSSSSKIQQIALEDDRRGFPERTFPTEILRIDPSRITFTGKGKEPLRDVDVLIDDEDDRQHLLVASRALQQGHLVAFPTETVYGLAGNALDENAAGKIFRAKGRPADNPLIVHISSLSMLDGLIDDSFSIPPMYSTLINSFWPGPLTLLFPANQAKVPSVVRCGLPSLGIRMPSHPVARALIATSNVPLAAPSANVSGKPSPTKAQHVFHDMTSESVNEQGQEIIQGRIPFIVDGSASDVGLESTVVDGTTEPTELRVLRPGGVSVEAIEEALQKAGLLSAEKDSISQNGTSNANGLVKVRVYGRDMAKDSETEQNPTTPGMKYRHYSPEARVIVLVTNSTLSKSMDSRKMAAQSIGESAARKLLSRKANEVIQEEVLQFQQQTNKRHVEIGLMSMDDSKLTSSSLLISENNNDNNYSLHRFSLGNSTSPEQAAHRLFDGLRTLDQGFHRGDDNEEDGVKQRRSKCDIIFVEAVSDEFGVGLAIMNRLNKAASQTILVDN